MIRDSIAELSDSVLLDATASAAANERRSTAGLIALLAELDARKLYLGEGYSSLFTYCTQVLHLSEPAAYSRITAARVARGFPVLLTSLAAGNITLTTITLLASHLTDENCDSLIDAAQHKSKRDVERLVACLYPQPDLPASVRRLPSPDSAANANLRLSESSTPTPPSSSLVVRPPVPMPHRPVVAPLAPERYLIRVTIGGDTRRKLERARDLLRHQIPNGDPALVLDRALTVLVEQLEKAKAARTSRPCASVRAAASGSRRVPAAVRRAVWERDAGRCAFAGARGRCSESAFLEFHHVRPFADGGGATVDNIQLRCRAHNAYEAQQYFGDQLCLDRAESR